MMVAASGVRLLRERTGITQAVSGPTEKKRRHDADPDRLPPKCGRKQCDAAGNTDDTGNLEAADLPKWKPKQRAKNLASRRVDKSATG